MIPGGSTTWPWSTTSAPWRSTRSWEEQAGVAIDLNNIGGVYYRINDYKEAIDYFSRSIERIEQLRRTARGEIRRDYLSSQIGTYQYLVSSTIRSGNDTEAFSAAEQTKARYLLEKMGERLEIEEIEFPPAEEIQGGLDQDEAILLYANIGWEAGACAYDRKNGPLA